ncbi:MAG: choice-of-anchor Q domain-containing protein [Chthoniobacterales bacterium]
MNKTIVRTLMLACMALATAVNANAATFVVNTMADTQDAVAGDGFCADSGGACSLRAAITEANALAGADIITLPAGTYTQSLAAPAENLNAGGDFDITSALTINGAGAGTTIVEANAAPNTATERVFHLITAATAVVINDVTVRHGNSIANISGSGIRLETATTNCTLNRVFVVNNRSAGAGGGISVLTAGIGLTINNSSISNNSAGSSVAGSAGSGAGLSIGGLAAATPSVVNITNTAINGNMINSSVSNTFGGGVIVSAPGATVTFTGCTINNNSSTSTGATLNGFAGGLYNQQAIVNLNNSTVSGNTASSFHGGIRTLSSTGGPATTNILNSTISNNQALGMTQSPNTAEGGGVVNIAGSTFAALTTITRSTVSGNTAAGAGSTAGGIENFSVSTGTGITNLLNSTVSGNMANDAAGIYTDGAAASVNLNYSTVAANVAVANGGGLLQDTTAGGTTNLKNSIVADNTAAVGPDIFGTITSQNYNHVENTAGGTFVAMANDVTGSDPMLGALANNGGPTQTHLPAAGSPVVDAIASGTSDCGTTVLNDQRLFMRPFGAGCDKGSVEVQPNTLAATGAVSRKMHGAAGTFDINLPFTGQVGIEDRTSGPSNDYQVVITFANPVTVQGSTTPPPTSATVSGTGFVTSVIVSGSTVTVNLTGVTDVQQILVTVYSVSDGTNSGNVAVPMKILIGDTNGSSSVTSSDIAQVKAQSGNPVIEANFRTDINASGTISSTDVAQVKSKSGNFLP